MSTGYLPVISASDYEAETRGDLLVKAVHVLSKSRQQRVPLSLSPVLDMSWNMPYLVPPPYEALITGGGQVVARHSLPPPPVWNAMSQQDLTALYSGPRDMARQATKKGPGGGGFCFSPRLI
ncbi:hypothetical protein BaRGS_00000979 [Batillaria attramentaria]|uniref:Uncharacterized protein n=1 Tax=Batillaria attramentaria TaxID=370345 RepID=A0ABD0M984_9CAEN